MKIQEFIDLIHELIAVDTEDGVVRESCITPSSFFVKLADGSSFIITVEKI